MDHNQYDISFYVPAESPFGEGTRLSSSFSFSVASVIWPTLS